MIDINLNAVPDWERSRRDTEPEVSAPSRAEAADGAKQAQEDEGSNGVEIHENGSNQRRQSRRDRKRQRSNSADAESHDSPEHKEESIRYDEDGDPVERAKRGRIIDTDA